MQKCEILYQILGEPNEPNQPKAVKGIFKYLMVFEAF